MKNSFKKFILIGATACMTILNIDANASIVAVIAAISNRPAPKPAVVTPVPTPKPIVAPQAKIPETKINPASTVQPVKNVPVSVTPLQNKSTSSPVDTATQCEKEKVLSQICITRRQNDFGMTRNKIK